MTDVSAIEPGWQEVSVWSATWQDAERVAVQTLLPALVRLEAKRAVSAWWWVRKTTEWRIRYLSTGNSAAADIARLLNETAASGQILRWADTIYEPPLFAFGGRASLGIAHALFHADSRHLADHFAGDGGHRRELGLLLVTALLHGAGRDWYDQGHVWELVVQDRPVTEEPVTSDQAAAVSRFLTADLPAAVARLGVPLAWLSAFEEAGRRHFDLDRRGVPTRGLGAILAHHVLYSWNRLGLPGTVQGALARAAAHAVFGIDTGSLSGMANTTRSGAPTARVGAVTIDTTDSVQLRQRLVDHIRGRGTFRTAAVERAFLTVPRELFLPGVALDAAYQPKVVVTKRAGDGSAISSASDPNLVATQAEDLDVRPGHKVLEIGAATGINAALMAELTGPDGTIVTIEIDDDLAAGARAALDAAGYRNVTAICGDGAAGWAPGAPYDRIIVTAGAWDISRPWWEQLAPGGRIVVPLRLHGSGLTRSIAFDLQPSGVLVGSFARVCGFVPMRGAAAHATSSLRLSDGVTLNIDTADTADEPSLVHALSHPAHTRWTGINVTDSEPAEHLDLWLATTTNGFARLSVGAEARRNGLADPALRWAGAALHEGGTIAYLAARPHGPISKELGVVAHGPRSQHLTERFLDLLTEWNHTRPTRPVITAYPVKTPDHEQGPGIRIERSDTRLTIAWG